MLIETSKVAILGANGFIGRAVAESATSSRGETTVHSMVRRTSSPPRPPGELYAGDVRDIGSIRAAIRGMDAVIHAASYIGYDAALCRETNVAGTLNVVEACAVEGVDRIVYVSTASVYGTGPHRGPAESELEIRPESALSRSRADAENLVLDSGGTVLRPDMVLGAGDRWFVPGLMRFTDAVDGLVDGGTTRMSVVHVRDLGAAAFQLAVLDTPSPGAYNIAYEQPAEVREIMDLLRVPAAPSLPSVASADARKLATNAGFTTRQFSLLASDHWFDAGKLRSAIGPGLGELVVDGTDRAWYQSLKPRSDLR
ncbi:NAD-dependent epimerase/dehydratase family protein [Agreia bicolorata]|uniref:NAD-dependent epimerase/dehydratase family protein n=1 Tax=Agreia bicolorata TaxID=110935 RepID=UPI0023791CB6|nr:NAD(P)-dependent oxidoreductase [Agreia bicolorata]